MDIVAYMQGDMRARQGCIFCLTCSFPELTEDHVLISAYVKIFRTANGLNFEGLIDVFFFNRFSPTK